MKKSTVIAAAAILFQGQLEHAQASPVTTAIVPRQVGKAMQKVVGFILDLLDIAGVDEDEPVNLWDFKEYPEMCEVYMSTHDGGECYASVECDEDNGGKKEYKNFPNCRVGGHSRFEDDRIGPFSIEFSERDGEGQGEGLTTPNLRLKYLNEWEPIAVNSEAQRQSTDGSAGEYGKAFLCKYGNYKASIIGSHISNQRTKKYSCGVPRAGLQSEDGTLDSNMPEDKKGYRSGTCSFHVKQFQKPDPSRDDYALEISSVKDANEKKIGGKGKAGPDVVLKTKLPKTISFKTGNVDADPVSFQYGDDKWTSDDEGRCSVGKYDSGDREMDCTFKCD